MMKNQNKLTRKKRKGFTLIELVIVVAVIGILALMVIPQFANVTQNAKDKTFDANCRTIVSAIGMYQAAHNGDNPKTGTDLDPYIDGGWASIDGKPTGATYTLTDGKLTAEYPDHSDESRKVYKFPADVAAGGGTASNP